ncbi:MAG: DinB family protein [Bacteroidota bacterium]
MLRPTPGLDPHARLRAELVALLRGGNAHVPPLASLRGIPPEAIHARVPGLPHTLWEVLYHLWYTQEDILDFCRNPDYAEREWPTSYWPEADGTPKQWNDTLAAFERDLDALIDLAETGDLTAEFDHAPGYTLLREILLAADHNAHHAGQVIDLRRALGLWPPPDLA